MKQYEYFAGIDLHKSVIEICVVDASGEVVHASRHRGSSRASGRGALAELERFAGSLKLAVEAIGFNRWLVHDARRMGATVVVANAANLALKANGVKTDRRDAYELARRLQMGDIERNARTYFPTETEYGERKLLRVRNELVALRTRLANHVRAMLAAYRIEAPKSPLYSKRSMGKLAQIKMPDDEQKACMASFLGSLAAIQAEIDTLDKRIKERADERAAWLLELPSVGPLTALTLKAELGDASRFESARQATSYAGLAPRVTASADRTTHGRLTRRGNRLLRFVLGEWAVRLMSFDEHTKRWLAQQRSSVHRNKMRSAIARRLLVGVWRTMKTGEAFDLRLCLPVR